MDTQKDAAQGTSVPEKKAPARDIELELAEEQSLSRHLTQKIELAHDAIVKGQINRALEILSV
jgi:hypothetical protein